MKDLEITLALDLYELLNLLDHSFILWLLLGLLHLPDRCTVWGSSTERLTFRA